MATLKGKLDNCVNAACQWNGYLPLTGGLKLLLPLLMITMVLCKAIAQPGGEEEAARYYRMADSLALQVKYQNDLIELSSKLTKPFADPLLKVRAIYAWITHNIAYDYKAANKDKEPKPIRCTTTNDCITKAENAAWQFSEKTARTGKAICGGYAQLFAHLCQLANVPCQIVNGAVRTKPYQVGNNAPYNHAWNAVLLQNKWQFIDATWAAGVCLEDEETGKLTEFVKLKNDHYFLTPHYLLIKNHWPKDSIWQAYWPGWNRTRFNNQPFYYGGSHYIRYLEQLLPDSGLITTRVGTTIRLQFSYPFAIDKIQINTSLRRNPSIWVYDKKGKKTSQIDSLALRRQVYWPYNKEGTLYTLDIPIPDRGLYWFEILFRYPNQIEPLPVLRYRVDAFEQK